MAWSLVIIAGIFEMGFAVLLKQSHGITRILPTAGFAAWRSLATRCSARG